MAAVWLATGSAVALMVGANWYNIIRSGGLPYGSDLVGHAATAEWLRTLPWWDWRGWSDWFYGGQAIGVNYPPLSHAWMRFTHPVHGQMAAVALGLLVLAPWGTLRLTRAVGYSPRLQRVAVGAVLMLIAISGTIFAFLPGFDAQPTFFGSWPAMLAAVIGLFTAAWTARCHSPIRAGIVAGAALLCNITLITGWTVIWAVLLATSGASFKQATRWAVTAGAAALAVSGWWLVPFLASWDRLVPWEVPIHWNWSNASVWHPIVLTICGIGTAWAARHPGPYRRLAGAAAIGLGVAILVDWSGWLRPERWMAPALMIAAISCSGLARNSKISSTAGRLRPVWKLHIFLGLMVFIILIRQIEILPLAVGLFLLPPRTWAWVGGLAWSFTLFWGGIHGLGGLWGITGDEPLLPSESPLDIASRNNPQTDGLVYLNSLDLSHSILYTNVCTWNHPWEVTKSTDGRLRPLSGIYRETSPVLEFISLSFLTQNSFYGVGYPQRSHWLEAWHEADNPRLGEPAGAEALGGRWYASCDNNGDISMIDLAGVIASGVTVASYPSEDSWHRAAARWWVPISAGLRAEPESWEPVPIRAETSDPNHPVEQAATGVRLRSDGDRLILRADTAGWAWLRVPWDPYWLSAGAAVHKGGPGHLVIWLPQGTTELTWRVPAAVDAAAAIVTAAAVLIVLAMAITNRRQTTNPTPGQSRSVRAAISLYADTIDEWLDTTSRRTRTTNRTSGTANGQSVTNKMPSDDAIDPL